MENSVARMVLLTIVAMIGFIGARLLVEASCELDQSCVPTTATVNGVVAAPSLLCTWILPDMNTFLPGLQYSSPTADHAHDDDMSQGPLFPGCDVQRDLSGAEIGNPSMPGGEGRVTELRALDSVASVAAPVRAVQLWAAVSHASSTASISDVSWAVFQPCPSGSASCEGGYMLRGAVSFNSSAVSLRDVGGIPSQSKAWGEGSASASTSDCDALGGANSPPGSMFEAASHTGQLTAAAIDSPINGLREMCRSRSANFYRAVLEFDAFAPCGLYKVQTTAIAVGGSYTTSTSYVEVLCGIALQLDFDQVAWNTVVPGYASHRVGDLSWDGNSGPNPPTVRNGNNDGMGISANFMPMRGVQTGMFLTNFDVCFGRSSMDLRCTGQVQANNQTNLAVSKSQILCAGESGMFIFTAIPTANLPADTYQGSLQLIGTMKPNVCFGSHHP